MCGTAGLPRRAPAVATLPVSGPVSPDHVSSAVVSRTTFYANSVYISFDTAYASDACARTRVRNAHTGSIIALPSSDVSSLRFPFYGSNENVYSFNYEDLNGPVPWEAYSGMSGCFSRYCSTIYDDYRPTLAVPAQVRSLDPAW